MVKGDGVSKHSVLFWVVFCCKIALKQFTILHCLYVNNAGCSDDHENRTDILSYLAFQNQTNLNPKDKTTTLIFEILCLRLF